MLLQQVRRNCSVIPRNRVETASCQRLQSRRKEELRIGIVACSGIYPIHVGGPANVGYFLAREFGRKGHDVTLFIRPKKKKELVEIVSEPSFNRFENVEIDCTMIDYDAKTLFNIPLLIWKIMQFSTKLSRASLDVVLFNSPPVDIALLTPIVSRLKGTKQAIIFHGYGGIYQGKYFLGSLLIRLERKLFDKAVVHSHSTGTIPLRLGFDSRKIKQIPNGLDIGTMNIAEPLPLRGSPRILFVGTLTRDKGVDTLIRAFANLRKELPRARLYIVGDGPERKELEEASVKLCVEEGVSFEGQLSPKELFAYYKSVDVFVLPSLREGFGIVLLEAMAANLPFVASEAVGVARELVKHSRNGRLFPPGNQEELADCLRSILKEKEGNKSERLHNREIVNERYNWTRIAQEYISLFEEILP